MYIYIYISCDMAGGGACVRASDFHREHRGAGLSIADASVFGRLPFHVYDIICIYIYIYTLCVHLHIYTYVCFA